MPSPKDLAFDLDQTRSVLVASRRRAVYFLAVKFALVSFAAVAAFGAGLIAFGRATGNPLPLAPVLSLSLGTSSIVAAIALWRRLPGIDEIARRADGVFNLQERLATAVEVSHLQPRTAAEATVRHALLADAERCAVDVEPKELVRGGVARELAFATTAALLFVAVATIPLPSIHWAHNRADALTSEEAAASAETAHQVAEYLASEAEKRNDPYLAALSRAFGDLSDSLESAEYSRQSAGAEIERLLDHVSRALGDESPIATEISQAFGGESSRPEVRDMASSSSETVTAGEPASEKSSRMGDPESLGEGFQSGSAGLESERGDTPDNVEVSQFGSGTGELLEVDYMDHQPSEWVERAQNYLRQQRNDQRNVGQPIGAAEEAGRGPSAQAGAGTKPLEGNVQDEDSSSLGETLDSVILPEAAEDLGGRMEIEVAPEAQRTNVADSAGEASSRWRPEREIFFKRDRLQPWHSPFVSRYFAVTYEAEPSD